MPNHRTIVQSLLRVARDRQTRDLAADRVRGHDALLDLSEAILRYVIDVDDRLMAMEREVRGATDIGRG